MDIANKEEILDIEFEEVDKVKPSSKSNEEKVIVEPAKEDAKSDEDNKQEINFLNSEFTDKFFKTKTKEKHIEEEPEENPFRSIVSGENEPPKAAAPVDYPDAEELKDISQFLMEIFDTGVGYICCAVSKTTKPETFEVDKRKKEKLAKQLAAIMEKRRMKMSLEWLFVISLLLVYYNPVQKAMKMRNDKNVFTNDSSTKQREKESSSRRYSSARAGA